MSSPSDPRHDADSVAERLRAAGPRPPMPPIDIDRVAAPALALWQEKVAAKRRRRLRRVAYLAAAVLLLAVGALLWRSAPSPVWVEVLAYAGPEPERFPVGAELDTDRPLRTDARSAERLTVALGGHTLRLDAGTELRVESGSRLELLRGAVYLETSPAPLRILAGGLVTEHIGTRFEVRLQSDHAVTVRVREGRVRVRRGSREVEAGRGHQVSSEDGEELTIGPWPATGDSWGWIHRALPPFESDGAELEAVITRLAEEGGWTVDVDPTLYVDASGRPVVVRGSVSLQNPREALVSVLESAGLRPRFDGDRLLVEEP